jgi:HEAT repeat protein
MSKFTMAILASALASPLAAQQPDQPKIPVPTPDLVAALIDVLKDADPEVRINAGNALAAIGSPAVNSLINALNHRNREARSAAAYALGQMGAEAAPAATALVRALKDVDTDVRRQAAQALSRIILAQRIPPALIPPANPPATPPPVFPTEKP